MSKNLKLKIIVGSVRKQRFGDKAGHWILEKAKKKGFDAELLDLRDWPFPFYDEPTSAAFVTNGAYPSAIAQKWAEKIKEADAFIAVSPEYNHSTSAALKNAFDMIYTEWNNKPIGFVAYGGVGGARAVEHLRGIAVELQMAPIRAAVHIPQPWTMLDKNGDLKAGSLDSFSDGADAFLDQLTWWTKALKTARAESAA